MLTSAIFLRAASFGIPTAQPLRTGLGRSFTAIARCGLVFQNKRGPLVTSADRIWQEKSRTPRVIPNLNNFAQKFHTSAVCRADCDWGRPCACRECREGYRMQNPICHICKINQTEHQTVERCSEYGDHGESYETYRVTSFCKQCWGDEESEGTDQSPNYGSLGWRMKDLRDRNWGETVPISYALDKIESDLGGFRKSRRWYKQDLLTRLKHELGIWRIGGMYMCAKERVDYMRFDLWYSVKREKNKGAKRE